jgi:hypothetical protein
MIKTITIEKLETKTSTAGVPWIALEHDGGQKAACWDRDLFTVFRVGQSIEVDIETNAKGFTNVKKSDAATKQIEANPSGPVTKTSSSTDSGVWDAKDRTSMYQTCVKAGTDIVVALMGASFNESDVAKDPVKTALEYADRFYARMAQVREGA